MKSRKQNNKALLTEITKRLEASVDLDKQQKRIEWEHLHNEATRLFGVSAHIVREISSQYYSQIKGRSKSEIFKLCDLFLEDELIELRTIAFDWAFRLRKVYEPNDFDMFKRWLKEYVHGWGGCDDLCTHAFGAFIYQFPQFLANVREWTKSRSTWMRRASAVVHIYSIKRKEHLRNVFETADLLLTDHDLMVQKGYGWLLKEASNKFPDEVFEYVMKNRRRMPRTALRYAIEKMPLSQRSQAMKRSA